jgi:hypothetical protein
MRGRGEVVDVGDAELNMRYATRERYQRLLAQDDVMCMCVHDCDGGSQRAPRRKFEIGDTTSSKLEDDERKRCRRMRTKGCICSAVRLILVYVGGGAVGPAGRAGEPGPALVDGGVLSLVLLARHFRRGPGKTCTSNPRVLVAILRQNSIPVLQPLR